MARTTPGDALVIDRLNFEVDGARLLKDISFSAAPGEFIGLIGPNGAGKSTLLRTIAGLQRARSGGVTLGASDLTRAKAREIARRLAIVGQHPPPTHGFTSLEIVLTGRYAHLSRFAVEGANDYAMAHEAMTRTGTLPFAEREAATLSGGERQRVFLARGLAQAPEVLILDEPTASLDVLHQLGVFDLARELAAGGLIVMMAVHDLRMAGRFCDRLLLMKRGALIADGAPSDVLTAANLESAFGVRALVQNDAMTGRLSVEFLGPADAAASTAGQRVHVIGGGGSASPLFEPLVSAGYEVTVGPLGDGDVDRASAIALGLPYLPATPFVPIDDATAARHRELIARADCVVLTEMPFGVGNVANLEAAGTARRLLVVGTSPIEPRDHTGGRATALYHALRPAARCESPSTIAAAVREALVTAPPVAPPASLTGVAP